MNRVSDACRARMPEGGFQSAGIGSSNATWMWFRWPASVKKPGWAIAHGVPISLGRSDGVVVLVFGVLRADGRHLRGSDGGLRDTSRSDRRPDAREHLGRRMRGGRRAVQDAVGQGEHAGALHRRGEHEPREARPRLPRVERRRRVPAELRHLLRDGVRTRLPAHTDGIAAEPRAQLRLGHQPLDQPCRRLGLGRVHRHLLRIVHGR